MRTLIFLGLLILLPMTSPAASRLEDLESHAALLLGAEGRAQKDLSELLEEKLGLDWRLPAAEVAAATETLETSRYRIRFPLGEDCNPWAEDLAGRKPYADALYRQIDEVVAFLADYHFRMLGRNESLFKIRGVNLCTSAVGWRSPVLGYDRARAELTLWLGPTRLGPFGPGRLRKDNLTPLSAREIRQRWNAGEAWQTDTSIRDIVDKHKNPTRAHWPLLDPIGETRTLLREVTRRVGLESALRLGERLARGGEALRVLADGLKAAKAPADVHAAIAGLGDRADRVASLWKTKLADPRAAEGMSIAAITGCLKRRVERQRALKIERTQIGFVNVENFHHIDVSLSTGDARDFEDYVVVPDSLDIQVTQWGIVNVSTTDRVEVGVALRAVSSPAAFESGTLRSVLGALGLWPSGDKHVP